MEYNTVGQNNSILIAQSISKLIERIKDKDNNGPELKYLKDKCISSDNAVVSLAASKGLIMLVQCEVLQVSTTLSELVSSLSLTKSYLGIIAAICDLLHIDLRYKTSTTEKYKCPFNLRAPQHPLISVLYQEESTWFDILSRIKQFYEDHGSRATFYANEMLHPFYMYVICNPTSDIPELFQYKLWNFLIYIDQPQSLNVILYVLTWLQISIKKHIIKTSNFIMELMSVQATMENNDIKEVVILWLTSLIHELIKHDQDPQSVISCLHDAVKTQQLENVASSMLIMLADSIIICPSVYLSDLLKLCKAVALSDFSNEFAVQLVKVALLQWLAYGCMLTSDSLQIANDILLYIEGNKKKVSGNSKELYSNKMFYFLKSTNPHVHRAVELSILSETLQTADILNWLNRTDKLPPFLSKNIYNYFTVLLLHEFDEPEITLKIIKNLLKIGEAYKETTTQLLTLFLYKLSNSTNPQINFLLLKSLPKMAVLKENLPLVLNTLELVKRGMFGLKSLAITLFFDLWSTDVKCYPRLQNVLVAGCEKSDGVTQWWEFQVTKAYVLKQICLKRPEVHGRELVGHLSDILNKCSDANGDVASGLAIDGIKALCKAGVVDISSTWNELAPRFNAETRVTVIKSLCNLMAEVADFGSSACADKLLDEVLNKLWYYATMHKNKEVISAAYSALGCFMLEQVSAQLPAEFKPTQSESGFTSSPSFGLIPGACWINLLISSQPTALDALGDFLIKYISLEISEYRSGTYKVGEGRKEPQDFNYLPEHSIVRALGNYIRQQVQKWQDLTVKEVSIKQAYLQCLRVLSQKYSKPLPPTDWCFLQELVHSPEARSYCITLASHQVQLSGTARRLVENYIVALTDMTNSEEDIKTVYKNLQYLCNSIQPGTLRPFIESSVAFALQEAQNFEFMQKDTLFDVLVVYLKEALIDEKLHEANRLVLSQVIVQTARKLDTDHPLFTKLLECIVVLPIRYIDELSSPRLWKEESAKQMKLSVRVRCALALKANVSPLTWLNDVIDAACFMPTQHNYVLMKIAEVMEPCRNSDFASAWVLELLGHIQSTIANENTSNSHIQFLCDVYILSVVVLAGQDIFIASPGNLITESEHRLRLFPQSIAYLMRTQCWKAYVSQISEWLFHMTNYHATPPNYKICFYQSLAALRHEDVFEKSSKWMKYTGSTITVDII